MAAVTERACAAGPRAIPIDVAVLEAWLVTAAAGDELVYSRGWEPARWAAAWTRARELSDEGEVRLHERRAADGSGREWFVKRRRPLITDGVPVEAAPAEEETEEQALLRSLRRLAKLKLPCRTNAEFDRELGWPEGRAAYRFRCLTAVGAIRVEQQGFGRPRLVSIVGTALRTASETR